VTEDDRGTEIRTASIHDLARIALALARAFQDDPVFRWCLPDRDRRREVLPGVFTVFAGAYQRHGHAYRTADGTGAALWVPPGVAPVDDDEADAFGAALEEVLGPDAARTLTVSELLDENHPHDPVWYLNFMGVEPTGQGRGIGSALLEHVLVDADRNGEPAYLDATSMHNRRLYERHGFVTTRELRLPDGPPMWPMWREPSAPPTT
jgi:ribosomal protein S18 acetylase RimI-like enzyme